MGLKEWNKTTYGHIDERKQKLISSLKKVQNEVEFTNSVKASEREMIIRNELEKVLDQEELLWNQKSRCDWLKLGDRIMKFFHNRTIHRRKSNRITGLRNSKGEWLYDPDKVQSEAVSFFKKLYEQESGDLEELPPSHFPQLEQRDIDILEQAVPNEEIKNALFDMAPLKALASDDYHVIFFQDQWENIGEAVCEWVKDVF